MQCHVSARRLKEASTHRKAQCPQCHHLMRPWRSSWTLQRWGWCCNCEAAAQRRHNTRFRSQHVAAGGTSPPQPDATKPRLIESYGFEAIRWAMGCFVEYWQWRIKVKIIGPGGSNGLVLDWYIGPWQYNHRYEPNAGCACTVHASYVSYNRDYDCEFVPTFWKPPFSYIQHSITWRVRNVNQPMETGWNHHGTGLLYLLITCTTAIKKQTYVGKRPVL